ncbi:hypothetical protein BLA60_36255 [Actinophytocola xinjiangensis]|uniref:Uncharacterized protein n=1 Tax=Actinophytocola xinjiangensis TaxID=485602 RepID=A0A7Z0WHJ8_9PSEU|nr:hypothetical protein [Actinophytocola xinjiangensis]OLF05487.1 hypothetical protein BLA60_36255 [Actinophytocola xinjiangensis]
MSDPHIHVEHRVAWQGSGVRDVVASAFGLAADAPSTVRTGCGRQVPYAMTAQRPESVTCLPCREHAHREHLRLAEQVEHLSRQPGSPVSAGDGARAAALHRDLAHRFA